MLYLSVSNACIVYYIVFLVLTVKDVDCNRWLIKQVKRFGIVKKPVTTTVNLQSNKDCNWCVWSSCSPSAFGEDAKSFNAADDVKRITSAMKIGINMNKEELIKILTSRSELQRQAIEREYKIQYGIELSDTLNRLTLFRFNKVINSLSTPLQKYYAKELHKAIERKDRFTMMQLFTTLSACFIREVRKYYEELYGKDSLESDITAALMEDFSKPDYIDILLDMAKGQRDETTTVNKAAAKTDAQDLIAAIKTDVWKTKMTKFQEVFTKRSIPQIKKIVDLYDKLRGKDNEIKYLEVDIENAMESVQEIYIYMLKIIRDQHMYFAETLEKVLNMYYDERSSEDFETIILIVRGRCDIDLGDIKEAYQKKYNMSLYSKISKNHMRSYRKTLLDLIQS